MRINGESIDEAFASIDEEANAQGDVLRGVEAESSEYVQLSLWRIEAALRLLIKVIEVSHDNA